MNDGEAQSQQGSDRKPVEISDDVGVDSFDDSRLGASGTSAMSGSSKPVRGQVIDPLFDDLNGTIMRQKCLKFSSR